MRQACSGMFPVLEIRIRYQSQKKKTKDEQRGVMNCPGHISPFDSNEVAQENKSRAPDEAPGVGKSGETGSSSFEVPAIKAII